MLQEADGTSFGCDVTVGANGFEDFQIWLDGDAARALHPGDYAAPGSPLSAVLGPSGEAQGDGWRSCWRIGGAEGSGCDVGRRYHVRRRVCARRGGPRGSHGVPT